MRSRTPAADSVVEARQFACQGVTAMECGDYEKAERLLRRAAEAAPDDADARRHLAEVLWSRDQRSEAISHMRAAVNADPASPAAQCRLGQMEFAAGKWDLACRRAQKALEHDPCSADAWALRARANQRGGDAQRAMSDYFRALAYAPNDRGVLSELAALYAAQGRPHRRLATVHRLLETYPQGEAPASVLVMEADAYAALARPRDAVATLRVAAERAPGEAAVLHRLAEAEEAIGAHDRAVAAAQRALRADRGHVPSQQLLARLTAPGGPRVQ